MKNIIFILGADLLQVGPHIMVGKNTAKTCNEAVRVAKQLDDYIIIVAAGRSEKYKITMSEDAMKPHLVLNQNIQSDKVKSLTAEQFNTLGECKALVEWLNREKTLTAPVKLYIVTRWWHMFRTKWLLKKMFSRYAPDIVDAIEIIEKPLPSWDVHMVIYETLAIIENMKRLKRRLPK